MYFKHFKILMVMCLMGSIVHARFIYKKSIPDFVKAFPETKVIECTKNYGFSYQEFPLYKEHKEKYFPNEGFHSDISILEIPQALVKVHPEGYVFINDIFLEESQIKNIEPFKGKNILEHPGAENIIKIQGRVAVINHLYSWIYGLFIVDILTALALLEIQGVEYDYLWVPYGCSYQKEAFEIWGIDSSKIIPLHFGQSLQADTIIFPTSVTQNTQLVFNVNYYPDFLMKYVRNKMLAGVEKMNIQIDFPEKIFISRKDASNRRTIINEDEVFALFEPFGYKRFEFSKFSMAEKIAITNHAKSIINFMGSGSTNILFAQPGLRYYEIQQEFVEASFYYLAQIFGFIHFEILNASTMNDLVYGAPFMWGRELPLHLVQEFIKNHPEL